MQFGSLAPGGFREAYPLHLYKRGLRGETVNSEIVRDYYDAARVSANINPVCSWVLICSPSRMNVPRMGWDLLKKANIFK